MTNVQTADYFWYQTDPERIYSYSESIHALNRAKIPMATWMHLLGNTVITDKEKNYFTTKIKY